MVHSRKQSHFCLAIHCTAKIQIPYSLLLLFFLRGKVGAGKEIFCASMIVIVVLNVKKKNEYKELSPFTFKSPSVHPYSSSLMAMWLCQDLTRILMQRAIIGGSRMCPSGRIFCEFPIIICRSEYIVYHEL